MAADSAEKARALEQCERDLDLAIERLVNLRLDPEHDAVEGAASDINGDVVRHAPAAAAAAVPVPSGGGIISRAEWVERLMAEMSSAADAGDARARAARFLEDFGAAAAPPSRGERYTALRENAILKKAVRLQLRLDREKEAANRELQRQLAGFQERVRSLEADKYALTMHLRRARPQEGSMSGRFHPEVF
ncbi:hypothetical protein PAHAL_5G249100 [Panicum hallii]|jgi:hypothetical protein|uniref:Uncharacterized protein n=1 Tax=Panicum hallii TaxID=206008 RepID=A0A2S3HU31_9POAL|nr:uncharacterized protein LOC112892477 [Panicum hallii]PAN29770.1 hypothetical protein PAHAL_5G249100 [Panicum hallii]